MTSPYFALSMPMLHGHGAEDEHGSPAAAALLPAQRDSRVAQPENLQESAAMLPSPAQQEPPAAGAQQPGTPRSVPPAYVPLEDSAPVMLMHAVLETVRCRLDDADLHTHLTKEAFVRLLQSKGSDDADDLDRLKNIHDIVKGEYPDIEATTVKEVLKSFVPGIVPISVEMRERVTAALDSFGTGTRVITCEQLRNRVHRVTPGGPASPRRRRRPRGDEALVLNEYIETLFPVVGDVPVASVYASHRAQASKPRRNSFALYCAQCLCAKIRRLSLAPYVLLVLVVVMCGVYSSGLMHVFSAGAAAANAVEDELMPWCPPTVGNATPLAASCQLGKATPLEAIQTSDDVLWVIPQIVAQLWTKGLDDENAPRSKHPMLGGSVVGAVSVRLAPASHSAEPDLQAQGGTLLGCGDLGLSETTTETALPAAFDCSAIGVAAATRIADDGGYPMTLAKALHASAAEVQIFKSPTVIIPANATRREAVALMRLWDPNRFARGSALYSVVVSWAALSPSTGVLTWTTFRVTLPSSGSGHARLVKEPVLVDGLRMEWFTGTTAGFLVVILCSMFKERPLRANGPARGSLATLKRITRLGTIPEYFLAAVLLGLTIAAWYANGVSTTTLADVDWATAVRHQIPGLDRAVYHAEAASLLVGAWLFVMFTYTPLILRDFIGVGRLVELLTR